MTATATPHRLAGLRFNRAAIRVLRNITTDLEALQPKGVDIGLYVKARESAEQDEPLVIAFTDWLEVELIADGFTRLGVQRPGIDELNGSLGR